MNVMLIDAERGHELLVPSLNADYWLEHECAAKTRRGTSCRNLVCYGQEWDGGVYVISEAAAQRISQDRCHVHVDTTMPAPWPLTLVAADRGA